MAGWLLVAGPILGLAPVGNPSLLRIWSASRAEHIRIVGAHRRGWYLLNAGFVWATVTTGAGLAIAAGTLDLDGGSRAGLLAGTIAYLIGGVLWCVVLAIRARVTPALADRAAADNGATGAAADNGGDGAAGEPAVPLLEEAQRGLFGAFVLTTALALVVIGASLALGGGVSLVAAATAVVVGILALGLQLGTGDLVPAVLYLPTLIIGIALLIGWT